MPAPQYVIRSYGGGADVAQLVENMGASDTSFTIAPDTGWVEDDGSPLGTVGPFTVVIDRFTTSVEKILCSAINLVTGLVTVYVDPADGWSGRGYDGSTAQAHVPGGSTSGVQTCWSSAEANEANQAVYNVLGLGGPIAQLSVPIGASLPFMGTPQTLPSNFLVEDGSAISRTTYSALFTAITIQTTGTTTLGGATISGIPSNLTPYMYVGASVTVVNSAGAIYTISSKTSTTIVLTSGTGITAGTGGGIIVYPHGAGDGSTTFNIPDSRGRSKVGYGTVGTNAQPTCSVGQTFGDQTVTISQSQLPTSIGTAAAQSVTDPTHTHGTWVNGNTSYQAITTDPVSSTLNIPTSGALAVTYAEVQWNESSTGITLSSSAVTNGGGGGSLNVESPAYVCTYIIRAV